MFDKTCWLQRYIVMCQVYNASLVRNKYDIPQHNVQARKCQPIHTFKKTNKSRSQIVLSPGSRRNYKQYTSTQQQSRGVEKASMYFFRNSFAFAFTDKCCCECSTEMLFSYANVKASAFPINVKQVVYTDDLARFVRIDACLPWSTVYIVKCCIINIYYMYVYSIPSLVRSRIAS